MKRMLSLCIPALFFGTCSNLNSRVFNSRLDGTNRIVNAGTTETQVLTSSNFSNMQFNINSKIMYISNNAATQGTHTLMKADFNGDSVALSTLGGATISGGTTTPLSGIAIDKIMLLDNGDLLVLPTVDRTKFYIVQDPGSINPVILASPAVIDTASAATKILNITAAGSIANGVNRIVVAASGTSAANLSSETSAVNSTLYTFLHDKTAGTITKTGQSKFSDGSAMSLGKTGIVTLLTGASSTNILNISAMTWSPDLNRLFIGTTGASSQNISFIAVARFASDDSNLSALDADDLVLEKFAPLSTANAANVTSMKVASWSVNDIGFTYNPATDGYYLTAQINYGAAAIPTGGIFALPVVGTSATNTADVGKLASTSGATTPLSSFSFSDYGFLVTQTPATAPDACYDVKSLVGGYNLVTTGFSDMAMHIYGNTVYLVARTRASSPIRPDAGVFASNPLYDANGNFAGWSAWKQAFSDSYYNVLGGTKGNTIDNMYFNSLDGRVYYTARNYDVTTPDTPTVNEIGMLNWGLGDNQNTSGVSPFLDKINTDFVNSGVWAAAAFPAITTMGLGNCGLTVIASRDKVALVSTGGLLTRCSGSAAVDSRTVAPMDRPYSVSAFGSTETASTALSNHYVYYDDIDGIGDVLCAEVARVSNANVYGTATSDPELTSGFPHTHGFIFVGGQNGIAVLRNADGTGFDASCGKKAQSAAGDYMSNDLETLSTKLGGMTFKKIPGINEAIHEMVASSGFLYAMGSKTVYRIRLHSYLDTLFPTNDYKSAASMFKDTMSVQTVDATETLDALTGSYSADYVGLNGTVNRTFKSSVVVIQPVLPATSGEYFCSMVGFPNTGSIFIGSNQGSGSNIYVIKYAHAASCDPNTISARQPGNTGNVFGDEYYKKDFSFPIRKLALAQINVLNGNLETYADTTIPTRQFISNVASTGLYSAGVEYGIIGNLYVLSGSIYTPSSVHVYAINGSVKGYVQNGSEKQLLSPFIFAAGGASWLSDEISALTSDLGLLPSGLDLTGPTYVYAHSSNGVDNHLNLLDFGYSPVLTHHEANTKPESFIFSSVHFENGSQSLFGTPFGGRAID